MRNAHGFTLVEVLVAIGIAALLFGISLASFQNFSRKETVASSATALAQGLRDARSRTISSVGATRYGVKVDADRFTFYSGAQFSSSTPGNETFVFPSWVRASSTSSTFLFERVTGNSSASGTVELYLVSSPSTKKYVKVQSTGLVSIE